MTHLSSTRIAWFLSGALVGVAATLMLSTAGAAEKGSSKVLLENDKVRVGDAIFAPGDRPGPHTHKHGS